jgi:DNA-binding Lrp family transcriptional regulator
MIFQSVHHVDQLDQRLVELLASVPRLAVLEMSRRLGVARATVQSRLDKLVESGVITGFGPDVDPKALGYAVTAFCTIEMTQGRISEVVGPLRAIPEVVEVHSIAGQGDLFVRVVARSNDHLMAILERILQIPQVDRTSTAIALACQVPYRTLPLIRQSD